MNICVSGTNVHIDSNVMLKTPYLMEMNRDIYYIDDLVIQQVISYINFINNRTIADDLYYVFQYMGHELPKDHGYKKEYYNIPSYGLVGREHWK
jgi:hypothetical protein